MKTIILLLIVVFLIHGSVSQDTSEWIRIDCGSDTSYYDQDGTLWQPDNNYIPTGTNKQLIISSSNVTRQLNSLRVFTERNKNCYKLPAAAERRYFIKATFHYGNYDGLSQPPRFGLEFDGNKWATVVTSIMESQYRELVYVSRGDNIVFCLCRIEASGSPFISSLEMWPLADGMYANMSSEMAWDNEFRVMYGAAEPILGYPEDRYNRVWEPADPSFLNILASNFTWIRNTSTDYPPDQALLHAIQAPSINNTFILKFNTSLFLSGLSFAAVHLTEPLLLLGNQTRSMGLMFSDGYMIDGVVPGYQKCTSIEHQYEGPPTIIMWPSPTTDLPPVVSAVELYSAIDLVDRASFGTSNDDMDGLESMINAFPQLEGWIGDPCLPIDMPWQWVTCGFGFRRIISVNLSGYGLTGQLPNFSQMIYLQTIDLGNNSLNGSIPDFLGRLPNLKLLILANNHFTGRIPASITSNPAINLVVYGNNDVEYCCNTKEKFQQEAGITIAVCLFMVVLLTFSIYWLQKKHNLET